AARRRTASWRYWSDAPLAVRVGARTGAPKSLILLSQVRQVRQVRVFRGFKLLFLTIYVLDETTSARKNRYTRRMVGRRGRHTRTGALESVNAGLLAHRLAHPRRTGRRTTPAELAV